jgi:hypothetical protein
VHLGADAFYSVSLFESGELSIALNLTDSGNFTFESFPDRFDPLRRVDDVVIPAFGG